MAKAHFDARLFKFLRELSVNNDRTWFNDNKARYEEEVKAPFLRFIIDVGPHLSKISERLVADPRGSGGSFFRIYRDTRFAKDKTPYKTHAAAQFRHAAGKDVHAPGLYLHLEPNSCFVGAGIWHPDSTPLRQIRTAIATNPKKWKAVTSSKTFAAEWKLAGDSLSKAPRGFDKEHPLIDDIKRKDFIAVANLKQKDVTSPDFLKRFAKLCKSASPFCAFVAGAVELEW